jgi:hypothetical protein
MTSDNPGWAPDSCTLPTADRPLRQAEFDRLFAEHVTAASRVAPGHLRLELAGPDDLAATVLDLTMRESECCSFFGFTVTPHGESSLRLDIRVDETHIAVLDGIATRVTQVSS